jgi:hypothetical protein
MKRQRRLILNSILLGVVGALSAQLLFYTQQMYSLTYERI